MMTVAHIDQQRMRAVGKLLGKIIAHDADNPARPAFVGQQVDRSGHRFGFWPRIMGACHIILKLLQQFCIRGLVFDEITRVGIQVNQAEQLDWMKH